MKFFAQRLALLGLATISFARCDGCADDNAPSAAAGDAGPQERRSFSYQDPYFTISYPTSWKREANKSLREGVSSLVRLRKRNSAQKLVVTLESRDATSLSNLAERVTAELEELSTAKTISLRQSASHLRTLGGLQAAHVRVLYRLEAPGRSRRFLEQHSLLVPVGTGTTSKLLTFSYSGARADEGFSEKELEELLRSISFERPAR